MASALIVIVAWEAAVRLTGVPPWLIPAPSDLAAGLWRDRSLLLRHAGITLTEALVGLGLGVAPVSWTR